MPTMLMMSRWYVGMRWSRKAMSIALTLFARATQSRSIASFEMLGIGFPASRGSTTAIAVLPYLARRLSRRPWQL